jgi:hypothetical protein
LSGLVGGGVELDSGDGSGRGLEMSVGECMRWDFQNRNSSMVLFESSWPCQSRCRNLFIAPSLAVNQKG